MKRLAYRIAVRSIVTGADYTARLFLLDSNAALDAMRKYVRKFERNSIRLLSCELDSDQSRPNDAAAAALSKEDSENMQAELRDKAERRTAAFNFALPVAYNADRKKRFHNAAKARLRLLAAALQLPADSFDLRSNHGGIAVSGEITLHTDRVYVQILQSALGTGGVLIRACNGRKDYTGHKNHFLPFSVLNNTAVLANYVRRVLCEHVWNTTHPDYKGMAYDRRYILELDRTTGATCLVPLESSRKVLPYAESCPRAIPQCKPHAF